MIMGKTELTEKELYIIESFRKYTFNAQAKLLDYVTDLNSNSQNLSHNKSPRTPRA